MCKVTTSRLHGNRQLILSWTCHSEHTAFRHALSRRLSRDCCCKKGMRLEQAYLGAITEQVRELQLKTAKEQHINML